MGTEFFDFYAKRRMDTEFFDFYAILRLLLKSLKMAQK